MNAVRAVAYIRRSTREQQENSIERQRGALERYSQEHGIEFVRWYCDDGVSGVEDTLRPGFQQMIADAERRRDFNLILVWEISRFGRFDAYQTGSWLHRLKSAGVSVQAIEGVVQDPYSFQSKLMMAMEQDRGESLKTSMRTLSGQRDVAMQGRRAGGKVPYGFARVIRLPNGTVEQRSRVGIARRSRGEIVELVLGPPEEVEAVCTMFRMARDGVGYRAIAAHLNDHGVLSPDVERTKTIATVPGRWCATTIRALLLNPAYCGDAIWNQRSMPKFHRLSGDKITPIDDFETRRFRKNSKADWIVKRDAHPAIIDRPMFDAVQQKIRSHRSMPRGHRHEFLLTGLISCASAACKDILTGTTRTRRKIVDGQKKVYTDPIYLCGGPLRARGGHAQVGIPRDGFERAVLRVLDEEIFSEAALAKLEQHLRREVARRASVNSNDGITALERRELDLKNRIAEGARRILQVGDDLVPEVRTAINELKDDLASVQASLERARRATTLAADGERLVQETIDSFRSMAGILRDPTFPLERRREVLRRFLPIRDGMRPIRVYFRDDAKRGWRKALKRVTVRHISARGVDMTPKMVAGAETFADGPRVSSGRMGIERVAAPEDALLSVADLLD